MSPQSNFRSVRLANVGLGQCGPVIDVADAALWPYRSRGIAVRITLPPRPPISSAAKPIGRGLLRNQCSEAPRVRLTSSLLAASSPACFEGLGDGETPAPAKSL